MNSRRLYVFSGIAGIVSVASYIAAILISWPDNQVGRSLGLLAVSVWPILSIVFAFGLCRYIAAERDGVANRLAFVFAVAAFATLLAMIIVQLAVGEGVGEIAKGLDEATGRALRRGLRLVDLGLDVAWDMLIGTTLICLGAAMRGRDGFGLGWAIPSVAVGAALIGLNAATFPFPPGDRGLFDIGPFVGAFITALAARLAVLGRRAAA